MMMAPPPQPALQQQQQQQQSSVVVVGASNNDSKPPTPVQSFCCTAFFACFVVWCCNPLFGIIAFFLASQFIAHISSHTRTVVRVCYKDDGESLWKSLKFDHSPR